MGARTDRVVYLGEITGAHGVQGWIKLHSYTEPRTNVFDYPVWRLQYGQKSSDVTVEAGQESGKRLIAKLAGIDDRDAAAALTGARIGVLRADLPPLEPGEYYWTDLEGPRVRNESGADLGRVERMQATGANDVLVLGGERMIPFVPGETVIHVDLDAGEIVVRWDVSYWD